MKPPMKHLNSILFTLFFVSILKPVYSQTRPNMPTTVAKTPVNYDEGLVGNYTLPDPLRLANGKVVDDTITWINQRRPELLTLFEELQFGKVPGPPAAMSYKIVETGSAFNNKALRKQITIYLTKDTADHKMNLLIYLPVPSGNPSPLFLALSFVTNAMAVDDPAVKPVLAWIDGQKVVQTKSHFSKIDVEKFIDAGFGYATVYYGDIEPDFKKGIRHRIRSQYLKQGTTSPAADVWRASSSCRRSLSRVLNYFETIADIAGKRI